MSSDSEEYSDALENVLPPSDPVTDDLNRTAFEEVPTGNESFNEGFEDATGGDAQTIDEGLTRENEEKQLSEAELLRRKMEAMQLKEDGNNLFRSGDYSEAVSVYSDALTKCPLLYKTERSVLFANRAACHAKQNHSESAMADCDIALELQPTYIRCIQRRAALREENDRLTDALEDYQQLLKLDPGNETARWACATLPDRIKVQQEEMKEKMLGQLKDLANTVLNPFGLSTDNFKVNKNPGSEGYSVNFVR